MKAWISKNWLQALVLFVSFALAVGIKFDPTHVNVYLGIASAAGLLGIRLMPLTLSGAPGDSPAPTVVSAAKKKDDGADVPPTNGLMVFVFVAMIFGVGTIQACTPSQKDAVTAGVKDVAACIEANANPGADPKTVAAICGVAAIPDAINIIATVIMSKTVEAKKLGNCTIVTVDAGAPDGAGK